MILLDTNVVSEPLRRAPEARVIDWIDAQPLETLYLSGEIELELNPQGTLAERIRAGGMEEGHHQTA